MAANISREAGELRAALADCRGDRVAEPKITAALLAHLLVSTRELLQNLLEVRGIGLLDIRAIFGETAVRRKMRLKLIVHLVRRETLERDYERLPSEPLRQDVLGIPVQKVVIQVMAGRNIAVLVEAAVRNTILQTYSFLMFFHLNL
jgi:serine kinase of HPr protein (carbohydrate metabolism regulator)